MENPDIIVAGGGLSGLTYAHFAAKKGKRVLALEERSTPGGCIHTIYPYNDDFFIELGAHTIYSSYGTILQMVEDLNLRPQITPHEKKGYLMHANGGIHSIFSRADIWGCLKSIPKFSKYNKAEMTVKEYYTALLGERNYIQLVKPITSAVICQDTDSVSAALLLKSRPKNKTFPRSFTMKGGLLTLLEAISKQGGVSTRLSSKITRIDKDSNGYTVTVENGDKFRAPKLVMALPAHETSRLISLWAAKASETLRELPISRSNGFGFGMKKENFKFRPYSYVISADGQFRGMVSRDVVSHPVYRGGTIHFLPDVDALKAFNEMRELFKIESDDIFTGACLFSLPQLRVSHEQWKNRLIAQTDAIENFQITGNFFGGLSMEDCAIRSKQEAQKL